MNFRTVRIIICGLATLSLPITYNACTQNKLTTSGQQIIDSNDTTTNNDTDSGAGDEGDNAGVKPPDISEKSIPAFMAIGHQGSRMYSCDGGQTWNGYTTYDPSAFPRCTEPGADCDHNSGAGSGVVWGSEGFIFHYGHGAPGDVLRTNDGETFDVVKSGSSFAGIAYGNATYVLAALRTPPYSTDGGNTWAASQTTRIPSAAQNARGAFFAPFGTGVFFIKVETGEDSDIVRSVDNGKTWIKPSNLPLECRSGAMAYYNGKILLAATAVCLSEDGGDNWQIISSTPIGGNLLVDVGGFRKYRVGYTANSADGKNWTETALTLNGVASPTLDLRQVKYHEALASYVAIYQSSGKWYEHTRYFHSKNGVNWFEVDKSKGLAPIAPHPIRHIAAGYLTSCE